MRRNGLEIRRPRFEKSHSHYFFPTIKRKGRSLRFNDFRGGFFNFFFYFRVYGCFILFYSVYYRQLIKQKERGEQNEH